MKLIECLDIFKEYSQNIINISDIKLEDLFILISSLSNIDKYSHVKIVNLKISKKYNNNIGFINNKLLNNRFEVIIENKKKLSIKFENLELIDKILYYISNYMTNNIKEYLKLAFKIPLNDNIIVIFYKGDHHFEYIDNINKKKIINFLEKSSYDKYITCNICFETKLTLICCKVCIYEFCQDCFLKFKNKKCPYCSISL
jgi:tRNA G10  N-methylase Trm11